MHGAILAELRKYIETKFGTDTWNTLITKANLQDRIYLPITTYPDEEATAILTSAVEVTGQSLPFLLEDFGEFITPTLMRMYEALIEPEWKTLDLIENTEQVIHRVVRLRNPKATPPKLESIRKSADEILVIYTSPRRLCGLAKGVVRGIAKHYGDKIIVSEATCMLQGNSSCQILAKVIR